MAKPSVFISSTYYDLKDIRENIHKFVESMGYLPKTFEKGGVGFDFQSELDKSCYQAVSESDIFVLIIGGRYGSPESESNQKKKFDSITKVEYITARKKGIPIYTFIEAAVLTEYSTYRKTISHDIDFAHVDDIQVFELISEIYSQKKNNFVSGFESSDKIVSVLREQWAELLQSHIKERTKPRNVESTKINPFKLYYYRMHSKMSITELAKKAGVDRRKISKIENSQKISNSPAFQGYNLTSFPYISTKYLNKIEFILDCPGKLKAGQHDDFLSMYLEYYLIDKISKKNLQYEKLASHPSLNFKTEAVVLDFDGTIAIGERERTTWELIWEELGYTVNDCAEFHSMFRRGEISHRDWCKKTTTKFKERNCALDHIKRVANKTKLVEGFDDFVVECRRRNIDIYILSGSIREVIEITLQDTFRKHGHGCITNISANRMKFDNENSLERIVGTKYDFQGKSDYIKQVVSDNNYSPMDILFVGNAGNDAWASKSGVRTLCVNPKSTDPDNPKQWGGNIREMNDMKEIFLYM